MANEVKKTSNRVKATAAISGLMADFYKDMKNYDKVVWAVGACPYEMFSAAGMARFQTENHAARVSSAGEQDKYIAIAEGEGMSTDCCSYAKINVGIAIVMARGEEDQIPENLRLPWPDMIFALNTCPSMIQWADALAEIFKVPRFVVDAPFIYDETKWNDDVDYVKRQLEDLVGFLEKITGRPYDWKNLSDRLYKLREMTQYRREGLECLKQVPTPATFLDGAIAMGPGNTVRDDNTVKFYKDFNNEIKERAKNGISTLENEKYRFMWRGNFPWHKIGTVSRMMTKYDAVIVSGPYAFRCYGDIARGYISPDGFDFSDPLKTIAADHTTRSYTRILDWKFGHEFRDYINGFNIDGVIIHSPRTCRPWALGAFEMAKMVEEEFGLPCLVLEADHTDPQYFNDAQVENKLQALMESIDTKRQGKK